MQLFGLEDSKKIGMIMMVLSIILYSLAVMLFFQRFLIVISNLCFLFGMYLFIGMYGSLKFFLKKGKRRGSILYFLGLTFILIHITIIGSIVQLFGLFLIFRSFLPDMYYGLTRTPYIGKYLKSYRIQSFLDSLSNNNTTGRI